MCVRCVLERTGLPVSLSFFLDFILPKAEAWRQDTVASTRSPLLAAAVAAAILRSAAVAAAGMLTFAVFVVVMIAFNLGVEV